jgi:hypothetical protein
MSLLDEVVRVHLDGDIERSAVVTGVIHSKQELT